jgi:hypothetical protein
MTETEAEWIACKYSYDMLEWLNRKVSDRKLRLFACACCRMAWDLLADEHSREAVETTERYADGIASVDELSAASAAAPVGRASVGGYRGSTIGWARST